MDLSPEQVLSGLLDREAPDAPHGSQAAAPPVSQALVQAAGFGLAQPQTYLPSLQCAQDKTVRVPAELS